MNGAHKLHVRDNVSSFVHLGVVELFMIIINLKTIMNRHDKKKTIMTYERCFTIYKEIVCM